MNTRKFDFSKAKNLLKWGYIVEALLILVGVVLRLRLYLSNPSFYLDECSLGFNILVKNYAELFSPLFVYQCAPPLFLVVSKFILNISHQSGNIYTQDLALRAFTLFCSIMSLPLFAIFLNKITNNKIFVWVCVGMLSLNTCAINYSTQFKQYSCELIISLILLLVFQTLDINKLSYKALCLYSLIFCVSIWFSNTAFILLFSGFLYFIFKCFSSKFKKVIKENLSKIAFIATFFIINLFAYYYFYFKGIYSSEVYSSMHLYWVKAVPGFFSLSDFSTLYPQKLQCLIETHYIANKYLNIFIFFNLIIFLFINRDFKFKTKFFVFTPILLSIIISFLNIYPFDSRLILFSLPLYIILYCQIISLIKPYNVLKILVIILLLILSINKLNTPINSIYHPVFNQPFRNSAEFIIQNKIPKNKIILAANEAPYYLYAFLEDKQILLFDNFWEGFDKSKIPQELKKFPKSDYYIFIPMANINPNYYFGIIHYLNNNKNIKILNTYTKDEYIYIIHFKKISDYK